MTSFTHKAITDCDGTHAMVQQVTIERLDDTMVSYSTRSASKTGDPDEALRRTFTTPRVEIWTAQIDGAPPPVAMIEGATGNLFLSKAGWEATTSDGFQIYGTNTEMVVFKYPWCAAGPRILSELAVIPTSIMIRGHLAGAPAFFELELLGPDAAGTQELVWNGAAYLALRLTPQGAKRLGTPDGALTAQVWPTQLLVRGRPAADPTVIGEVDVLDSECAGWHQRVVLDGLGSAVTLSLTSDGINEFHVAPQRRAS